MRVVAGMAGKRSVSLRLGVQQGTRVVTQPLNGSQFANQLKMAQRMWESCLGANAGLKLISLPSDDIVTSSFKRIAPNFKVGNPLVEMMSATAEGQLREYGDGGLYVATLTTTLLANVLRSSINQVMKRDALAAACQLLHEIELDAGRTDWEAPHMLAVVRTIIRSKPLVRLNCDQHLVAITLLKAFLQRIPDNQHTQGEVILVSHTGDGKSELFEGILYPEPAVEELGAMCELGETSTMLFTCGLNSGDAELVTLETKLVACQKVVSPGFRDKMRRRGIVVLERLGTDQAGHFARLTGTGADGCGRLSSVSVVRRNDRTFLLLANSEGNIITVRVTAWTPEGAEELKVVCQQVLDSLRIMLHDPHVLPGGGCFEATMAMRIQQKGTLGHPAGGMRRSDILESCGWLSGSLLHVARCIAGSRCGVVLLDSAYHHLWRDRSDRHCCCSLVRRDQVEGWVEVIPDGIMGVVSGDVREAPWINLGADTLIDLKVVRMAAIRSALETCQNMLQVGMTLVVLPPK